MKKMIALSVLLVFVTAAIPATDMVCAYKYNLFSENGYKVDLSFQCGEVYMFQVNGNVDDQTLCGKYKIDDFTGDIEFNIYGNSYVGKVNSFGTIVGKKTYRWQDEVYVHDFVAFKCKKCQRDK